MKCGQNLKEESTNDGVATTEEINSTPEVAPVVEQPSSVQETPVAKSNRIYKESTAIKKLLTDILVSSVTGSLFGSGSSSSSYSSLFN